VLHLPDPSGIEALVTRWAGLIRAAAARYRIGSSDLDELVQDVRLRLWRQAERTGREPRTPAGFVYRAAVSAAIDIVRRQRNERARQHVTVDEIEDGLPDRGGSVALGEEQLVRALERALEKVSVSRRPAVRLHLAGRHLDEIARVMAWSPARARNLLYRGLEELRGHLREEAEP
jgi:RNA polymerase sigma-70 factor (ECF subfamily)